MIGLCVGQGQHGGQGIRIHLPAQNAAAVGQPCMAGCDDASVDVVDHQPGIDGVQRVDLLEDGLGPLCIAGAAAVGQQAQ
ncbi:hypothetical protein D3C78_1067720 [compost metagenome]